MVTVLRFLFLVPFGFLAACLVGAFALLWPFLSLGPTPAEDPLFWIEAGTGFALQAMQLGSVAFLPWACFVLLTECLALRSLILHCVAGLAGAFAYTHFTYGEAPPHGSVRTAILVAGLAFALVYWLAAGHGAGRWRRDLQRDGVSRMETAKTENTEAKT